MLKYSPILYFFNSPETRLINITTAVEIRIKILSDSKRSEEMRARLIEDLVGRQVDKMTLEIIKQISISESVLLSTISKEFLQEYE